MVTRRLDSSSDCWGARRPGFMGERSTNGVGSTGTRWDDLAHAVGTVRAASWTHGRPWEPAGRDPIMFTTTTRDRIGAGAGAAFVAVLFAGNAMATSGQSASMHPTGKEILRDATYAAASTTATVGFMLEVSAFLLFFVFLGFLANLLRRYRAEHDVGVASATAVVAGAVMLAIKLGSVSPVVALYLDRDRLSPEVAQVLSDINGAAFLISWLPFALFVGCAALALQGIGHIGRPTTYIGLAAGVAGVALGVWGLVDPVAASPLAFLVGMLWLMTVSIRLAVRPAPGATAPLDHADPVIVAASGRP